MSQTHPVNETALVFCPIKGRQVDVERCLCCPLLEDFDLDSRRPHVVCRVPPADELVRRPAGNHTGNHK